MAFEWCAKTHTADLPSAADLKNEIHARYDPAAGRLVVWGRINEEITEKYGEDGG